MVGYLKYHDDYWVSLQVDEELTKYLRTLYFKTTFYKLLKPIRPAHITIISIHEWHQLDLTKWRMFDGTIMDFSYRMEPFTNDNAVWITIDSPQVEEYREFMGLSRKRQISLHLAIGYKL